MKKAQLPPTKELNLGKAEVFSSKRKHADLPLNDNLTREQQAKALRDLGREHAREWLKNPHSHPFAWIRLQYQDSIIGALKWGEINAPGDHVTAVGILDLLAMYGAGLDEALQEFVLLAKEKPPGVMQ